MAEPATRKIPGKARFDVLTAAAVVFFLAAVAFAAVPAINAFTALPEINAAPETLAGLMLLFGLAGVASLGLFVLRGSSAMARIFRAIVSRPLATHSGAPVSSASYFSATA